MLNNFIALYLIISIIVCIYIGTYTRTKGSSIQVRFFFPISIVFALYLFGYLLELTATNPDNALFWMYFQSISSPFIAALWLDVSCIYITGNYQFSWWKLFVIYLVPTITLIVRITNELHHFYYTNIDFLIVDGNLYMVKDRGLWNYVQSIHSVMLTLGTIWVYFVLARRNNRVHQSVAIKLFFGMVVNIISLIFNFINFGHINLNYLVLSLPLTLLIFVNVVSKHDFFEVKSLARDMIMEYTDRGIVLIDESYKIVEINERARDYFKDFKEVNVTRSQSIKAVLKDNTNILKAFLSEDGLVQVQMNEDGNRRIYEMTTQVIENNRKIKGQLKVIHDITENHRIRESLIKEATTDYLSGISNRRYFMEQCKISLDRCRSDCTYSMLMIDVDYFKNINDTYGHDSGDEAIRTMGQMLRESFSNTEIIGRLGGEEFGVFLIDSNEFKAYQLAENFRKCVESKEITTERGVFHMTVSIGLITFQYGDGSLERILKQADNALYRAKNSGRNKIETSQVAV